MRRADPRHAPRAARALYPVTVTQKPRDVSSPFDHPTERIPTTDEDLGLLPTEQIPTYNGPALPAARRTPEPVTEYVATAYTEPEYVAPEYESPTRTTEVLPTGDAYDVDGSFALEEPYVTPAPAVVAPAPARLAAESDPAAAASPAAAPRGTLDLGLLVLRVAVGALALGHGLQKLFGWWAGPGLDGFETTLVEAGFDQARLLATLGAVAEVAGGVFLIVGLMTPLAAAAVLVVMINAWCVRQVAEPGLQFFAPAGVEYETLLVAALIAVILCGPGRIAVDGTHRWATRPRTGSALALILGVAAGVCLWIFLDGANPLI